MNIKPCLKVENAESVEANGCRVSHQQEELTMESFWVIAHLLYFTPEWKNFTLNVPMATIGPFPVRFGNISQA